MTDHVTQPSLLSRVRDPQNAEAWTEFEKKYRDLLMCYAARRGLQPADAEDVRQQVMFNLSRYLRDFKYDGSRGRFRSYLGRMVRHAVAQHFARRKDNELAMDTRIEAVLSDDDAAQADAVWEEEWMNHHYRHAMETVCKQVEPKTAAVFDRFVAGETADEIAADSGLSIDAAQKIKQRMRDRLRKQIALQIEQEDKDAPA
ncbi:MAG: sigma-70 family RNA polymerase sigma factor [Phycisphaerales bacterium]|nr:sigma-70 family RNA polymerase sigma factor [Phycisphaerales bacterium]